MTTREEMVPLAEAAVKLRLNREQLLRRIQQGSIVGGKSLGYWYVERGALEQAAQRAVQEQIVAFEQPASLLGIAQRAAGGPHTALEGEAAAQAAFLDEALAEG